MKNYFFLLLFIVSVSIQAQFGYKKFYFSAGFTGQYMTAPKYTGYDINLTAIPRYNFVEFGPESTLSIEARPQIGIGFRNWYRYREYDDTFPQRISYSIPVLLNINWGLNSEENSLYLVGLYLGGGYSYGNVFSETPPYDPVQGFVIDAGIHIDGAPISHVGLMYTIGNDGSRVYSFGFYYDF